MLGRNKAGFIPSSSCPQRSLCLPCSCECLEIGRVGLTLRLPGGRARPASQSSPLNRLRSHLTLSTTVVAKRLVASLSTGLLLQPQLSSQNTDLIMHVPTHVVLKAAPAAEPSKS